MTASTKNTASRRPFAPVWLLAAGGALVVLGGFPRSEPQACGSGFRAAAPCALSATLFRPLLTTRQTVVEQDATTPVEIGHLAAIPGTASAMVFLVTEDRKWHIPITIGLYEAEAIARARQSIKPARPMTHELLSDVLQALDARLERVTLSAFENQTFKATLTLRAADGRKLLLDARPSDSLSLALHAQAELRVAQSVLDAAGVPYDEAPDAPPARPAPRTPRRQPERPRQPPPEWLI